MIRTLASYGQSEELLCIFVLKTIHTVVTGHFFPYPLSRGMSNMENQFWEIA